MAGDEETTRGIFGVRPVDPRYPCSYEASRDAQRAQPAAAFTLIELLAVIAIMAALAALLLPVVGAVKKHQYIYNAQAEMAQLETAIDRYKAAYGFYPPDNLQSSQSVPDQPALLMNWWERPIPVPAQFRFINPRRQLRQIKRQRRA